MNEQEHSSARLAAQATAARTVMLWAGKLLHDALPPEAHLRAECVLAIQQKIAAAKADYRQMTFPEMHSAVSDLMAGEFQEAFDLLTKEFESCISPKNNNG